MTMPVHVRDEHDRLIATVYDDGTLTVVEQEHVSAACADTLSSEIRRALRRPDARPSLESAPQLRGFAADDNAKPHVCHEETFMGCGHHDSMRMSSVESDETWCGLCEMQSKLNDALAMERRLTIERNEAREELRRVREEPHAGWCPSGCDAKAGHTDGCIRDASR